MVRRSFSAMLLMLVIALPAWAADPVATVLGQPISREQIQPPNRPLDAQIMDALFKQFARQQRLVVSDSEIADFEAALKLPSSAGQSDEETLTMRQMAHDMVLQWKIGRALYQRYGGDVIFQQANPMEPIDAMQRFFEDQEKAGAFTIHDDEDRKRFHAYFRQPRSQVVPASDVDFDTPWWLAAPR